MYEPVEVIQDVNLTPKQLEILDFVINKHSGQTLPQLKKSHYETEPMQSARIKGERLNMNGIKRRVKTKENNRIKSLQSRIKKMKLCETKSPIETAEHYKSINASLEKVRNRANAVKI